MTNINTFFPEGRKSAALGLNAGGGNLGVAVIQLVALLVIATAGAGQPKLLLAVYIPLIVISAVCAALYMGNIASVRNDTGAFRLAVSDRHTAIMALLYIGTFGSFIGYSFAFGLVLQTQFGRTALQAAAVTFLGPLLGSLIRPLSGWLADRAGGARITAVTSLAMAVSTLVCVLASRNDSLPLFTAAFIALFVLSGLGIGSTYAMIPTIFRRQALERIAAGADEQPALMAARQISGAAIGLISAVGALGGLLINLAFRQSFASAQSGVPAFWAFLVFYLACTAVTVAVYVRRPTGAAASSGSSVPTRQAVATHCPYCALQCAQWVDGAGGVDARQFPTNRGGLCQKGWTSGALLGPPERLTTSRGARPGSRPRGRWPRGGGPSGSAVWLRPTCGRW